MATMYSTTRPLMRLTGRFPVRCLEAAYFHCFDACMPPGRGGSEFGGALPTSRQLDHTKTVWPSGLRRWLKAPFRKGVGSNPTAVTCSLIRQPFRECHATSLVHASHIPGALLCGPLLHVVCWRLWEWATSDASSVLDSSPTPQSSIMSRGQTTRDQAGGQYCPSLGQLAHRGNLDISHSPQ